MAVVLTVLLYACESWTVYSRQARNLNHFHSKCLRIILRIKWQDMVPDTEVLTRAGILNIHTLLQKAQVRWAGHVTPMPDDRLPKQFLYGEICYGKRSVGGQKKRFKDTLKKTLISFNIDVTNWEVCAQDRPLWRSMIHTGARTAETNRIAEAQKQRAARNARLYSTISASAGPTYPCSECRRVLQTRIGLISHLRTHRVNRTCIIIIIIEEVTVIIGNDGRTTVSENEVVLGRTHRPPQRRPVDLACLHVETIRQEHTTRETSEAVERRSGQILEWNPWRRHADAFAQPRTLRLPND